MNWYGDHFLGDTVRLMWNSFDGSGGSITRSTNGTVVVYEDLGVTEITSGITDTEDFDTLTGVHAISIAATTANGFERGKDYHVVLQAATIDTQTVNAYLGSFSIENRYPLKGVVKDQDTCQASGSHTTSRVILASGGVDADDEFNTYILWIYGGTNAGEMRVITDSDNAGDYVDVFPNLPAVCDNTSTYRILLGPPISVLDLPTVDGSGRVSVGDVAGTTVTSQAGDNFNTFFDNSNTDSTYLVSDLETELNTTTSGQLGVDVTFVNGIAVTGSGTAGDPWGP